MNALTPKSSRNIAVIPARGGSKRIPRKNIRAFGGKPLIAYSIDAARASGLFDHVIVTTDDDEIAEIAQSFGAEVPFRRPPELANDHATTVPVIKHAISWALENIGAVDYACCIYATAPFIQVEALTKAYAQLIEKRLRVTCSRQPPSHFRFSAHSNSMTAGMCKCLNPRTTIRARKTWKKRTRTLDSSIGARLRRT